MIRRRQPEWMDENGADPAELSRSLRFIRRINHFLGYTRAILHHLDRFSRNWARGELIELVDLATGSADIPREILRRADRRGWNVRITAVDRHPVTVRVAGEGTPDPRLRVIRGDVFDLPLVPNTFDYALCSMFLHHLDEDGIVRVMTTMDRLSRRGVIISDLLRHRRALLWINLLTLFSNRMVRHDAAASVAQALTKEEVLALRDRAGLGYAAYFRHFGHRFVLAGEKKFQPSLRQDRARPA